MTNVRNSQQLTKYASLAQRELKAVYSLKVLPVAPCLKSCLISLAPYTLVINYFVMKIYGVLV